MKQLTKVQIINQTVKFYSADPSRRSVDKLGVCSFNGHNGKEETHCAVGRCLLNKYKRQGVTMPANDSTADGLASVYGYESLDELLLKKYRGHSLDFWSDLQLLHDKKEYWNSKGLTTKGKKFKAKLIEAFSETINQD